MSKRKTAKTAKTVKTSRLKTKSKKPASLPKRNQKAREGRKKGNPGFLKGPPLAYLETYADEYCKLSGKKDQMRDFWANLFLGYWE